MSPKLRQTGYYALLWVVSLFFFAPVAWIVLVVVQDARRDPGRAAEVHLLADARELRRR